MELLRGSEVIGLSVVCIEGGKKVGVVQDVVFSPVKKEVKGLLLQRSGWETGKKVVLLKDIDSMEKDAIIINNPLCKTEYKKAVESGELGDKVEIRGLKVYSKTGEDLGQVKDFLFDSRTGLIEGVEVSDGLFNDLVQGRKMLPLFGKVEFGEENILVDKEAVDEIINTGGGIKRRLLNQGKE